MEYQEITNNLEGSESMFTGWFLNILLLFLLGATISTQNFQYFLVMLFPILTVYCQYIFNMLTSPVLRFLKNKKANTVANSKIGEYFKTPPVIKLCCECYNQIIKREYVCETGEEGGFELRSYDVVTHRESLEIPYYSARDISGLLRLNVEEAKKKSKAYIRLIIDTEINFADAISYSDYISQKETLCERNKDKDKYVRCTESKAVPGLQMENIVVVNDHEPSSISTCLYYLFVFLMFGQFYKTYVKNCYMYQYFKIRKLVSTRYNLMDEDNSKKYFCFNPELNSLQQHCTYEPREIGYVNEANKFETPTEEELEKAQQYQKYIPNYSFQSVGGNVGNVGIVQDIPQFQNVDYNNTPSGNFEDKLSNHHQENQNLNMLNPMQEVLILQGAEEEGYNSVRNQESNPQENKEIPTQGYNSIQKDI